MQALLQLERIKATYSHPKTLITPISIQNKSKCRTLHHDRATTTKRIIKHEFLAIRHHANKWHNHSPTKKSMLYSNSRLNRDRTSTWQPKTISNPQETYNCKDSSLTGRSWLTEASRIRPNMSRSFLMKSGSLNTPKWLERKEAFKCVILKLFVWMFSSIIYIHI